MTLPTWTALAVVALALLFVWWEVRRHRLACNHPVAVVMGWVGMALFVVAAWAVWLVRR